MDHSRRRRLGLLAAVLAAATGLVACGDDDADEATAAAGTLDGAPAADLRDPERRGPQGNVAQFVVECELSHLAYDDPIVLPDLPGESHHHQFFGNAAVTADSDYHKVAGADTTCRQSRDTASYWAPTLMDEMGRVVEPRKLTAYYRPGVGIDPASVVAYPPDFQMVAGNSISDELQSTDVVAWSCGRGRLREQTPPDCAGQSEFADVFGRQDTRTLRMLITFPDCWDGDRLSSFGSGAHVAYSEDGRCPDAHAVSIPQLVMAIDYPPTDPTDLSLSSGPIETGHADFWNVWDQDKLEEEVRLCLNRDLVCGVVG